MGKLTFCLILLMWIRFPKKKSSSVKTDKQEAFLTHLVETQGDAREAAKLAGYSSHYHHVVKTLKSEILELTQEVLANSAPKAAFKLVEIMESKRPGKS